MKITTRWVVSGTGEVLENESYDYHGPLEQCCGASSAQTDAQEQQASAYKTMTNQAQQVFGDSSSVFQDLQSSFAPTIAAGPDQQGFSPAERAALNSRAITQTGQSYRNARQAVGEAQAAAGGGNTGDVVGGANVGTDLNLASSAANQTASELNQIDLNDYAVGRQNYNQAAGVLSGAPGVFGASTNAGNAATGAGEASANTANQIATQNNSWMQAVSGAIGGVAGVALGGMTGGLSTALGSAGKMADGVTRSQSAALTNMI